MILAIMRSDIIQYKHGYEQSIIKQPQRKDVKSRNISYLIYAHTPRLSIAPPITRLHRLARE